MSRDLPRINEYPAAFEGIADAFNRAMEQIEGITNLTSSDSSITITEADENTEISVTAGAGGGLPPGYTFEEFTICDSGSPATRWWPTWLTNPEA